MIYNLKARFLSVIFFFCVVLSVNAGGNIYFKTGPTENLESEGIKFRGMKDCSVSPLPLPASIKMTNPDSEESVELFNPIELWRIDQFVASWNCEAGGIFIGKISLPIPEIANGLHGLALRSEYEKWRKTAKAPDPENKEEIKEWLRAFFALPELSEGDNISSRKNPQNCKLTSYSAFSPAKDRKFIVYVLEPQSIPDFKFAILYDCIQGTGVDTAKNEKAIAFSISSFEFSKVKASSNSKAPSSNFKTADRMPEYLASRSDVINNIKNADGWDYTELDNFILLHNVKAKRTIKEIGENLERSRKVFETFYPLRKELTEVSVCRFFEKSDDYKNYVGENYAWTGGLWIPSRKELVISPFDWANRSQNRKIMVEVAFHEGFHQYMHYAADGLESSIWFNEGNATFFEGINFKGSNNFDIEASNRLADMKKLIKFSPEIKKIISMGHAQFSSPESVSVNYSMSWGLMFFLHKGSRTLKDKNNYSEIPLKYYNALIDTRNKDNANDEAWKNVDMLKFEKDFRDFWQSDSLIKKAEKINPVGTFKKY